jgi:hypothetical protein
MNLENTIRQAMPAKMPEISVTKIRSGRGGVKCVR